jgi:hypothetical protein
MVAVKAHSIRVRSFLKRAMRANLGCRWLADADTKAACG